MPHVTIKVGLVPMKDSNPETNPQLDPFHYTDPLSRRYHSPSTSPTSTVVRTVSSPGRTPRTPQAQLQNVTDPAVGLRSEAIGELVTSDIHSGIQKKKRLSVGDRLRKLGKELGRLGKLDKGHASSALASDSGLTLASGSHQTQLEGVSWNSQKSAGELSLSPGSSTSPPDCSRRQTESSNIHLSMVPEAVIASPIDNAPVQLGAGPSRTQEPSEPEPEATTLAKKLQHLIDSLPLPHVSPHPLEAPLPITSSPINDPSEPQAQQDSQLIALLSNASFMNGSSLKGKPSIWSILENTHRTSSPNPDPKTPQMDSIASTRILRDDGPAASSFNMYHNQISNESSPSIVFSDTSSVMVYSPLIPTQADFVELAELVPFDGESETQVGVYPDIDVGSGFKSGIGLGGGKVDDVVGGNPRGMEGGIPWTSMWPFSIWYGADQAHQSSLDARLAATTPPLPLDSTSGAERRSAEFITSPHFGTNNDINMGSPTSPNQRIRSVGSQKSIRAWVPSLSKLSVQVFWWGYRLYLPPPILSILSDKTLEATKRSAMITTALTWFFNNLPIDVFPPPMKPVLLLLQRLAPFLGYIGTFISWSWSTIRSYDVGYGVTLTATWILPVALIPGTWFEMDFPKSPTLNSPIPLPPRPLSIHSFVPSTPFAPTPDSISTSAYATPISSPRFRSSPLLPDINGVLDASRESDPAKSPIPGSSMQLPLSMQSFAPPTPIPSTPTNHDRDTLMSAYATPMCSSPPLLPGMSPRSLCFNSDSAMPVIAHSSIQPQPQPQTCISITQVPLPNLNVCQPSLTPLSPRIHTPHSSAHVKLSSSSINSSVFSPSPSAPSSQPTSHHLNVSLTPIPIPIAPIPIELSPTPPELPFSPKLVNQLLRGPMLQTVPLPDVDIGNVGGGWDQTKRPRRKSMKIGSSSSRVKTLY